MENQKIRLLVVDDEDAFRELLVRRFSKSEFAVIACGSGEEALELVRNNGFDVGAFDMMMPGISGIELLREIKSLQPEFEAVIITGQATIDSAIEAMKLGAYDYLAKPCKLFELEVIIRKAYEKKMLAEQNKRLRQELRRRVEKEHIIGSSEAMKNLRLQTERVAVGNEPVLISGENGVGKEVAAMVIHRQSSRKEFPFVTVNCGVLSEGVLDIELFGHETDAFVGAGPRKRGLVETAEGGAVFLDEVEQLTPTMQVKVLHFLDTGEFRRVGGYGDLTADTRFIFGTTEDLLSHTKRGKFREDFFYKISTFSINILPLREHKEDIPELIDYLLSSDHLAAGHKKRFSKKAIEALMNYYWPGNIQELTNVLERSVNISTKNVIQMKDLPLSFEKKSKTNRNRHLLSLSEIEKEHILFVLDAVHGNISKTAKVLGISRPKLYRKMERYRSGTEA